MKNLFKISADEIENYLNPENLEGKNKRSFEGFEIIEGIDDFEYKKREVSLVSVLKEGEYPQHIHKKSDASFIVVEVVGSPNLLKGNLSDVIKMGDIIEIPKGTPHGFRLKKGESLKFISIQIPPIKDPKTGKEDFFIL